MRRQGQDVEQCKENMTTYAQLVFCWYCSPFEDKPKRCACAASLSAVQYGGILTGYAAANLILVLLVLELAYRPWHWVPSP